MKKTYIPSTPRSRKLKSVGGGTINVSGGSAQSVPVIEGHTHDNKIILDAITQLHLRILSSLNVDEDGALIVELSNIIKELDTTVPTDENLFSALRTVLEIRARSISKTDPDTAQEIITFLKGIIASGTSKFDNIEVGDYTTGPLGAGAAIKMENGVSRLEVDNLDVRMRATFRELIIESLKHIGGELVLSPARMKCVSVADGGSYYRCYFDNDGGAISNEFVAGDQARCQVFTGSGTKFYWRLVTSVGDDWINLSKTDAVAGSDIPEAGDEIVQLGNRNDTTRQNAQILSTVGPDAPSWKQYKGINSFSLEGKDTTVFSGTGNKIDGKTVFVSSGSNLDDYLDSTAQDIQDAQAAANAAALLAQQAIDNAEANVTLINQETAKLQAQIDGEVSNWFYPYSPTLANYPASDWTTNEIKDRHIGDTFTNTQTFVDNETTPDAGKSWRFVKNGSTYSWTVIADSDAVLALQKAAQAQSTADGKSTTFLVQPSNYKLGDMWVLNADRTVNGTAYKQGEILTATQDSTTFVEAHWLKRVRYTDDTAVNNLEIGGRNLFRDSERNRDSTRFLSIYTADILADYVGRTITVSFDIKATISRPIIVYPYQSNGISIDKITSIIPPVDDFQRFHFTATVKDHGITNPNYTPGAIGFYDSAGDNPYTIRRIKIELGNKATDWSPAPEDVQAAIDAAVVKATYWSIKASAPVIYKDAINAATSGAHTPVTVSGELRSGTTTTQGGFITVTPNGGTEAGTASASPVTIAPANGDGKTSYTVRLYDTASKTTLLDTMTIPVVFKGASGVNAINVVLSNEADVLPASPEGTVSDYSGSGTEIRVFEGATELSYGTSNGQYQVSAVGSGITVGTPSTSGNRRVYGVASNMTSDNATITFTITGKTASGTSFSLTKVQSFAKSRTGQKGDTGASAPLLYLSASAQVMKCNPDNTPQTGQTISIEAKLQNVSGTATFVATPYDDAGTAQTPVTLGGSGNTRTLTNTQWLATYKRIEVVATLGSLTDKVTIYRVADGATGKGISGTEIKYQVGTSGTTAPTGTWLTSVPAVPEGQFLWTRTTTSYTDSTTTTSYSVSKQGVSGAAGKGISSTVVTYQASSSGTVVPTGTWSGTIPSVSENQYLWTRTVITYTDSSTSTSYSVGKMGAKGDAGQNAIVGLLTNESVTLQANSAGVVSSFTPANGEFWVYNGTTKVTSGITFSKVSETGCTAAITSAGVYSVSAMSADNATVVLRAVYGGVTIDKVLTLSKSRAGADGVSITLVDVEFAKNTNPTTAPTTGWTTTAPTLAEGEQLWTRTKTAYSSGNPTYSTPANITPKKGDTGAVGQGVESVTEEFAISTSKTTQPTTGWSTTQPTWVQGQYIWSRVKVVYKNPTSTVYTGYAVSSEWEAVNNLEIGGRNLLLDTYNLSEIQVFSSRGTIISKGNKSYTIIPQKNINAGVMLLFSETLKSDTEYTLAFDVESNIATTLNYLSLRIGGSWSSIGSGRLRLPDQSIKAGLNSIKITFNTGILDNINSFWNAINSPDDLELTYSNLRLMEGNKTTDWSPAPEDVQAAIDAEKTRINDILSDNVADPSEKQYLSNLWQEIYAEYPRIWAQANDYSVSKTTYEQKYTALKNILDPVLANLTINSTVSGSSIRTAFSQYYDARTALQNAITNEVNQNAGDAAAVAADALAKANTSKAITDKFKTTINGGLINTVMMLLRDLNSVIETAGISGIQGELRNNPAFWAGGTYAQAFALIQFLSKMSAGTTPSPGEYEGLAKITMLHNGAAKVGDFIIEESGRIVMIDPATGKPRLMFTVYNLPLIADLMSGTVFSGSTDIGAGSTNTSQVLTGSTNVTKDGARVTFGGTTISINGWGSLTLQGASSHATASLYAYRDGVRVLTLASVTIMFAAPFGQDEYETKSVTVDPFTTMLAKSGLYTFRLEVEISGNVQSAIATSSSSSFSWQFTEQDVRYQQYGLDGMMFFYSDHHFHFTESGGMDGRALPNKWNAPGVLLSASVGINGTFSNWWGAKKHGSQTAVKNSTGRYTVYHTIGHENYQVTATALTANRSCYIVSKGTSSFVIEWRTIGSSPSLVDTPFDFQITGNNYNT